MSPQPQIGGATLSVCRPTILKGNLTLYRRLVHCTVSVQIQGNYLRNSSASKFKQLVKEIFKAKVSTKRQEKFEINLNNVLNF